MRHKLTSRQHTSPPQALELHSPLFEWILVWFEFLALVSVSDILRDVYIKRHVSHFGQP